MQGPTHTGQPIVVHEVIAKRIIKATMKGEHDPARLRGRISRFGIRPGSDLGKPGVSAATSGFQTTAKGSGAR